MCPRHVRHEAPAELRLEPVHVRDHGAGIDIALDDVDALLVGAEAILIFERVWFLFCIGDGLGDELLEIIESCAESQKRRHADVLALRGYLTTFGRRRM
jgi:hypothetical protein